MTSQRKTGVRQHHRRAQLPRMNQINWKEKRKIENVFERKILPTSAIYQRGLKVLSIAVANGRQQNLARHWIKKSVTAFFHNGSSLPLSNRTESTGMAALSANRSSQMAALSANQSESTVITFSQSNSVN